MNGLYQVSDLGEIRNSKGRILKPEYSNKGYACVHLRKDDKNKKYRIHRLVAQVFIPNPDNLPEINHKDENKANNHVSNLEWCDNTYNSKDLSVYCFDLDKYFKSASEAAVHTGACRTSILKVCRGQLHQAGGMLWCYSKDKDKVFP